MIDYSTYSAKAGKSRFFHQLDEIVEQVARIMRAGGGFGVVLDGEGLLALAKDAFVGVVVKVQVR